MNDDDDDRDSKENSEVAVRGKMMDEEAWSVRL